MLHGFIADQFKANRGFSMQTTFFFMCPISVNSREIILKQIRPFGRFGHYGLLIFGECTVPTFGHPDFVRRLFPFVLTPVFNALSTVQCYTSLMICGVTAYPVCNPWSVETRAWWLWAVEETLLDCSFCCCYNCCLHVLIMHGTLNICTGTENN